MEKKKIDLLKLAQAYTRTRKEITEQLAYVDENNLPDQIRKVANSIKKFSTQDKSDLVFFLNALCCNSPSRSNLLVYRIGRRAAKRLVRRGLKLKGSFIDSIVECK